jgi:uncharacterized protein (DUF58 family)
MKASAPRQPGLLYALRPAPALIGALLLGALIGIPISLGLLPAQALFAYLLVLLIITLQQALALKRMHLPDVSRDLPAVLPVGVSREIVLRLKSRGHASVRGSLHDDHPQGFVSKGLPVNFVLNSDRQLVVSYLLTPHQRGEYRFGGCHLKVQSPFNWLTRKVVLAHEQDLKVYPNFAPLAKLTLIGAEQASRVIGAHVRRKRGDGTEFQQLREYRPGDSMRQIDWKASQRMRKLISREYQEERNQKIILALDTGRRMMARDGTLSHFDHTLNASLVLAHMALRKGDAVGLQVLSPEGRYLPPGRGLGTVDAILNTVFDLHAECEATDYLRMFEHLSRYQTRRALILVITNVRDEDIEDMLSAVIQLRKKHLVCVASLREDVLESSEQNTEIKTMEQALRLSSIANYIGHRERAHEKLRSANIDVLDVSCSALPSALVEHYLRIKKSGKL